jgi:hypothetical protein
VHKAGYKFTALAQSENVNVQILLELCKVHHAATENLTYLVMTLKTENNNEKQANLF